jgi:hypothetical protein
MPDFYITMRSYAEGLLIFLRRCKDLHVQETNWHALPVKLHVYSELVVTKIRNIFEPDDKESSCYASRLKKQQPISNISSDLSALYMA